MIRMCEDCGAPSVTRLCPRCQEQEKRDFQKVRDYLRANHLASVPEAAAATDVSEQKILRWVNKGWLEVRYECQICGKAITKGTICADCASRLGYEEAKEKKRAVILPAAEGGICVLGVVSSLKEGRMGVLKSELKRRETKR